MTDLPTSPRVAYVGIDNRAAGATAAYLVDQWLGDAPGSVLVTRGDGSFRGEDEREMGFRATQRALRPEPAQIDLVNADGHDDDLHRLVRDALAAHPDIVAVYSMYAFGGNRATVEAFAAAGPRRTGCSSPTTCTSTTWPCCTTATSRPCCTTTCARTCATPAR